MARVLEFPYEPPSWIPEFRKGIIEPVIPDREGMIHPFTRPGLGFEIDKKLLKIRHPLFQAN